MRMSEFGKGVCVCGYGGGGTREAKGKHGLNLANWIEVKAEWGSVGAGKGCGQQEEQEKSKTSKQPHTLLY